MTLCIAALASLGVPAGANAQSEVVELSASGVAFVTANAVNDSGQVAGQASFGPGDPATTRRAFRWRDGVGFTNLGVVGARTDPCCSGFAGSGASDINNAGVVVGDSTTSDRCFPDRGVVWVGDSPTTLLDGFGHDNSQNDAQCPIIKGSSASGINAAGYVTGTAFDSSCGQSYYGRDRAFVAAPGSPSLTALPSPCAADPQSLYQGSDQGQEINASGSVLSRSIRPGFGNGNAIIAKVYSGASVTELALQPAPHGLNDSGVVVGQQETNVNVARRYENGAYAPLPPLPGFTRSSVASISDTNVAVGTSSGGPAGGPAQVATMWKGTTPVDLNSLLPPNAPFQLGSASDISDDGHYIVGEIQASGQVARSYRLFTSATCVATAAGVARRARTAAAEGCLGVDWTVPDRLPQSDDPGRPSAGLSELAVSPWGTASPSYVYPANWPVDAFVTQLNRPFQGEICGDPNVELRWSVTPARQLVQDKKHPPPTGCKPRFYVTKLGDYIVEVTEYDRVGGKWVKAAVQPVPKPHKIEVKDWLIVGMGDSNASGEGNPQDTGTPVPLGWLYRRCNRSTASYQYKTAQFLEQQDHRSSVTFIFTACSGARIKQLWGERFSGVRAANPPLPPQIDQVLGVLAREKGQGLPRKVDAAIISAGVNDLQFGPTAVYCAEHPYHGFGECQRDLVTVSVNRTTHDYTFTPSHRGGYTRISAVVAELQSKLGPKYNGLHQRLIRPLETGAKGFGDQSVGLGLSPTHTFVTQYPDFSHDVTGATCDTTRGNWVGARNAIKWNAGTWGWFGRQAILLDETVRATSRMWQIPRFDQSGFQHHGYCAPYAQSWFIGGLYGTLADDQAGTLHPNDMGHDVTAAGVEVALCRTLYTNALCLGKWRRPQ